MLGSVVSVVAASTVWICIRPNFGFVSCRFSESGGPHSWCASSALFLNDLVNRASTGFPDNRFGRRNIKWYFKLLVRV